MATIRKLRGRWQAQVRRKGMKCRAKSFDTRAEAERWARTLETELDRHGVQADTKMAESLTLKDILVRYLDEVTPSKRSAPTERCRISALLKRDMMFRTMARLTPADVASYRDERLRVVASSTVLRELNTIGHAIETARREWGLTIPQNPVKMIRRPKAPRPRERRLHPGEEERLLAAAGAGRSPWMRLLIILAIETAMRQGEILSLRWSDVNLETRIAHLEATKNGERRDVPLSSRALKALQELAEQRVDDRVIPSTKSAVGQAWLHLRARAGSPDLHYHDLRHEAVTRLLERGLNVIEVSTISGHKELRMLQRYAHLKAVDLVERLG